MSATGSRITRLIVKEVQQLRRDPVALRLTLVAPVLQLVLLGYAASLDVRHIPTVIADLDRSVASREMIRSVVESGYFDLVGREERSDAVIPWLDEGRAVVALVFPPDYGERLEGGRRTTLQAVVDGSNSSEATTAIGHLSSIVMTKSIQLAVRRLPPDAFTGRPGPPVQAEMRVWYNEAMESSHFMVPGVIGLILMISTMLLTAIAVTREKEIGTIEQILVTPVRSWEFLLGKMVPYSVLGFINVGVVLALGHWWFGVPMRGSVGLLYLLSGVFLLTTLGIGLFAASVSLTQQTAMLTCMAFVTPNMLLSGFIFPIENMPAPIQMLTYLMPVRYFLTIIRGILLKGIGLEILWPQALALTVFGAGIFLASLALFRARTG
ncbi:MAG: ABC transporter permease [Candidatus Polarisedimenticolia bacterium]